ncbi:MAG: ribosomal protein methyltransferase [Methylobacteriaceae bacterium]|nr:ribosomal protein methyltransferase [Methylobacteriaceae bacterium]
MKCQSTPRGDTSGCVLIALMLEGLPPNDATHIMRLTCNEAEARAVADLIVETFDPAQTAASAFEKEPSAAQRAGQWQAGQWQAGQWILEVYFGFEPDEAAVRDLVAAAAGAEIADAIAFDRVERADWIAASLAGFDPVRAGRFLVVGSHARQAARANDIVIEIEAALAFGTGHHGTTMGCLLALDRLSRRRRPRRILDIGTGSGILAIAAAKRWKRQVTACDIDATAVAVARNNAIRNSTRPYVHPVKARGTRHPMIRGRYDLILANILAVPLKRLAGEVARVSAPGGTLVLSGLLARDVPGVLAVYQAHGCALIRRHVREGWSTLMLCRHGA